MSKELGRFQREIVEVCEFYVDKNNEAKTNVMYRKGLDGSEVYNNPTEYLRDYLSIQGIEIPEEVFVPKSQEIKEQLNDDDIKNELEMISKRLKILDIINNVELNDEETLNYYASEFKNDDFFYQFII